MDRAFWGMFGLNPRATGWRTRCRAVKTPRLMPGVRLCSWLCKYSFIFCHFRARPMLGIEAAKRLGRNRLLAHPIVVVFLGCLLRHSLLRGFTR